MRMMTILPAIRLNKRGRQMTVDVFRMQRKSGLQLRASCSWHVLKPKINFSLASKTFWCAGLITQFLCDLNFSKNFTCPLSELRTEFTSPIEKSTSPGLSDTTFFARWVLQMWVLISCKDKGQHSQAVFPNGHYKWTVLLRPIMKFVICRLLPFGLQIHSHVDWWFFISESMSLSILKRSMAWMKFSLLMR